MKYEKTPNIKEDIKEKRQNYYTSRVQYKNVVCDMKGECMAKEKRLCVIRSWRASRGERGRWEKQSQGSSGCAGGEA